MARILGVDIPNNKRVLVSLTYIYGIGLSSSQKILKSLAIDANKRVKDLTEQEVVAITKALSNYKVEGDLRQEVNSNIKNLMEIGNYVGIRHRRNLPVRGQRTQSNARTRKGPRKTVANKKKEKK